MRRARPHAINPSAPLKTLRRLPCAPGYFARGVVASVVALVLPLTAAVLPAPAAAAPAPWYQWRSVVDSRLVCAQASPGPGWQREGDPFEGPGCQPRRAVVVVPWREHGTRPR